MKEEQGWGSDRDNDKRKSELSICCWLAWPGLPTKLSLQELFGKESLRKEFSLSSSSKPTFLHHLILKISSNLLKRERKSETQFTSHFIPLKENHFLEQLLYSSNNNLSLSSCFSLHLQLYPPSCFQLGGGSWPSKPASTFFSFKVSLLSLSLCLSPSLSCTHSIVSIFNFIRR